MKRLALIVTAVLVLVLGIMSCTSTYQPDTETPAGQSDIDTPPTQQQPSYNPPPQDYPQLGNQQQEYYLGLAQMYEDMANAAEAEAQWVWDRLRAKSYDYSDPSWKVEALADTIDAQIEADRYQGQADYYRSQATYYRNLAYQ